jgi:hypothetical protein
MSAPSLTVWNRLIMQTRYPTIDSGLEARVHDPMWMLARQYQMGEFLGQDAGSPIAVRLAVNVAPISRYHPEADLPVGASVAGRPLDSAVQPLEPLVEGEAVHLRASPTPRVGAETGLRLLRALRAAGLDRYTGSVIVAFPFSPPTDGNQPIDPASARYLRLMQDRVPDGRAARAHFSTATLPAGWPGGIAVRAPDVVPLQRCIADWLSWYTTHYDEPAPGKDAWDPSRQEYRFAVAAHDGTSEAVFAASDYYGGRLDWDALRAAPGVSLGAKAEDPGPRMAALVRSAVPAQLAYRGMPASRWWELEDQSVDFGSMRTGRTDLIRMLFIDYALTYSNDWFLVPLDLPYGTFSQVTSFIVTDVFGVQTAIPRVSQRPDAAAWRMYTATGRGDGLLLPQVLGPGLESAPIEDVRLLRDEMANQAWGIEYLVEGAAGEPFNRHEAARAGVAALASGGAADSSALRYRIASVVPPHWIPFVPVRQGNALVLQRGEMLADPDSGGQQPTRPLGRILEPDRPSLRVFDEEVPRAGIRVTRAYQHARGADGRVHLWLGRRKTTARHGDARSGLRFDKVEGLPL